MSPVEPIFSVIINIISSAIYDQRNSLTHLQKNKVQDRVKAAVNKVVRPALLSLEHEGVPRDRQLRLLETCTKELGSLIENPKALLEGSLNGQKTFEHVYQRRSLPQVVVEDGLQDIYALIYPRVATLLCSVAVATESWEVEAWSENFRRLDKVVGQIEDLFSKIDAIRR